MDKSASKNVYVFVEQREGVIQSVALELLGKARELADELGEQVYAILLGKGISDKAQESRMPISTLSMPLMFCW